MNYYRFYNGRLYQIEHKADKSLINRIDHTTLVTDTDLLTEIEQLRETSFSDEDDMIRVAFTIAVKLKSRYLKDDVLMFNDGYHDWEIKPRYRIIMESDFSDAIFFEKDGDYAAGYTGHEGPVLFKLSYTLQSELAKWQHSFEKGAFDDDFDWDEYNYIGLVLAKKVKDELGDLIELTYSKPFEDPNHDINKKTLIQ